MVVLKRAIPSALSMNFAPTYRTVHPVDAVHEQHTKEKLNIINLMTCQGPAGSFNSDELILKEQPVKLQPSPIL